MPGRPNCCIWTPPSRVQRCERTAWGLTAVVSSATECSAKAPGHDGKSRAGANRLERPLGPQQLSVSPRAGQDRFAITSLFSAI